MKTLNWFAWYPVRLNNGEFAWLVRVNRTWTEEAGNWWGDTSGYSGRDSAWVYTLKE